MSNQVNRRKLIKQVLTGSAALAAGVSLPTPLLAASEKSVGNRIFFIFIMFLQFTTSKLTIINILQHDNYQ